MQILSNSHLSTEEVYNYLPKYLPNYLPTYVLTYLPTYLRTYVSTYPPYLPTYLPSASLLSNPSIYILFSYMALLMIMKAFTSLL